MSTLNAPPGKFTLVLLAGKDDYFKRCILYDYFTWSSTIYLRICPTVPHHHQHHNTHRHINTKPQWILLQITNKHMSESEVKRGWGLSNTEIKHYAISYWIPVHHSLLGLIGPTIANSQLEVNKQKCINISCSPNTQNHNMAVIIFTQSSFMHFFIWLML